MHVVTGACVDACEQRCIEECPLDCIHHDPEDRMVYINPETCIDCRGCVVVCPTDAIFSWEELPDPLEAWQGINELWFTDPAAARVRIDALVPRRANA